MFRGFRRRVGGDVLPLGSWNGESLVAPSSPIELTAKFDAQSATVLNLCHLKPDARGSRNSRTGNGYYVVWRVTCGGRRRHGLTTLAHPTISPHYHSSSQPRRHMRRDIFSCVGLEYSVEVGSCVLNGRPTAVWSPDSATPFSPINP